MESPRHDDVITVELTIRGASQLGARLVVEIEPEQDNVAALTGLLARSKRSTEKLEALDAQRK